MYFHMLSFFFNCPFKYFCHVGVVSFCAIPYLLHALSQEQMLCLCNQRIAKEKGEELNPLLQVNTCTYIFMYKYLYFRELQAAVRGLYRRLNDQACFSL